MSYYFALFALTSFSRVSADTRNNFANANRFEVLGSEVPASHFETACLLTPQEIQLQTPESS